MASPQPPPAPDQVAWIEPAVAPIVTATDLGSVQVLKEGNLYLLTDPFGDIDPDRRGLGLYEGDTRRLSCLALRINGERPVLLQGSAGGNWQGTIQLTDAGATVDPPGGAAGEGATPEADAPGPQQLAIARRRTLTATAFTERLGVVNHGERARDVRVELDLAADTADIFEVRGWNRPARGELLPVAALPDRVTFRYDGLDGVRRTTHVAVSEPAHAVAPADRAAAGSPVGGWVRLTWRWRLAPGETRDLDWTAWSADRRRDAADPDARDVLFPPVPVVDPGRVEASYENWRRESTSIQTANELVNLTLERGLEDLRLLQNPGPAADQRYLAAGVPWYTTLFGRDAIITALQTLCLRPQLAVDTLEVLASLQADEDDPERDAEPGKILHELRTGEMAMTGEVPHRPYFGTVDATPLWLILLGATWDWTGDRALVDRLWPNALRALDWIDRHGDRDGDGFVEYERRSDRGHPNQGWKDSPDGIRDRGGVLAAAPIALAEVQGYVFDAKRRIAGLARLRGDEDLAARLEREAEAIRSRFESAFWLEAQGYYAMALDGRKRQADAIASNPGHGLWSGIVAPDRAGSVVDRLLGPGLFSGWGIRSYAAGQPGYNPIGYHTGSVWPHDVALIAAGCKRYGYDAEANRLAEAILEASRHFTDNRLPEVFAGFGRDSAPQPVPYPVSCSPQAWAAGAVFQLLETMLGLRPHADRAELEIVRPDLPDWLGDVRMAGLRVGDRTVDLRFHRRRGITSVEVLRRSPDLRVTIHA